MTPIDLLFRIKKYYLGHVDKELHLPAISTLTAVLLSTAFILSCVLPFYLSPSTRPSPTLNRDAPSVIRARIQAMALACLTSSAVTLLIFTNAKATPLEALRLLGWWPVGIQEIVKTMCLTALLFAGPLYEKGIVEEGWRDWIRGQSLAETLGSWIGYRNYVVGPVAEEILFRSVLISVHLLANVSPVKLVFLTPLYFGIAHVHHFYEFTLTHPHTPLLPALLRSLFQFTYTTLFGWYASFLYLRTGSLPAVMIAHSFCNWCQLPRVWGMVEGRSRIVVGAPVIRGKQDGPAERLDLAGQGDGELKIGWTVAYYVLLFAGAFAFYAQLWPLTNSTRALVSFGSKK